ncbi:MAG: cytoplasmic protein [Thermodesulfobacteriota bacterium]|nr:cytoplasmic protein [Thermodesulfobacteriota bacterium]
MKEKGYEVKVIIEGAATKLVPELAKSDNPLHKLWGNAKYASLVDGVCKACSNKMGALEAAKDQGLALLDEMTGHPSMARYHDAGFEVITF